jgi:hypothetical protein
VRWSAAALAATSGLATLWLAVGCAPREALTPPGDHGAADASDGAVAGPLVPDVVPVYATGEPLTARIPGIDGAALELAALRGRAVVVAFVDPATPSLGEHVTRHHAVAEANGMTLVLVATEASTTRELGGLEGWIGRPDLFLGWDPQGALATKLRIERLPTTLVLDPLGRVVAEVDGSTDAELADAAHRATQAPPAPLAAPASPAPPTSKQSATGSSAPADTIAAPPSAAAEPPR